MLYKIAAKKKKRKKISPAKLERDARKRVRDGFILELLDDDTKAGLRAYGAVQGAKHKAELAGSLFGPVGVNGVIARKTGVSTLWPTIEESAKMYGGYGAIAGGIYGLAHGLAEGRGVIPRTLSGVALGAGLGAALGGIGNGLAYGLGYMMNG